MNNIFKEIIALLQIGILLIIIGIFLSSLPSEAYFKNISDEVSDRKLSESITQTGKSDFFIPSVYKNNKRSTANIEKNQIINYRSDLLTELMEIDIQGIHEQIQPNTIDSGRFIENLIYANLRIQRLIGERKKIIENSIRFNREYAISTFDAFIDYEKNEQDNELKYGKIKKINDEFNRLTSSMGFSVNNQQHANIPQAKQNSSEQAVPTISNNFIIPFNTTNAANRLPAKGISSFHANKYIPGSMNSEINTSNSYNANTQEMHKPIKPSELPWFFKIFISLIKYFMKNKIEGLIYLGMVLFVVSVFAAGRR